MKIKAGAAALAAVLASAASACSSGGGTSGNVAGDSGTTAPGCYATVTPADNDSSVTVAALGTPDCASVVQFPGDQFPGYTVTPATDPTGDSEDAECTLLESSPPP